jgi:hypothetical protein
MASAMPGREDPQQVREPFQSMMSDISSHLEQLLPPPDPLTLPTYHGENPIQLAAAAPKKQGALIIINSYILLFISTLLIIIMYVVCMYEWYDIFELI